MEFEVRKVLTTVMVGLALSGCGKSAGSNSASVTAQAIQGSYVASGTTSTGDTEIVAIKIENGVYESRQYFFAGNDLNKALLRKEISSYVVSGNTYTIFLTYLMCSADSIPARRETFPITAVDSETILVHSNAANKDIAMVKVDSIEQALARLGTTTVIEDTDCNGQF